MTVETLMLPEPFSALLAVEIETPASRATSFIVTLIDLPTDRGPI